MPRRTKKQRYQDITDLPNVTELQHFAPEDHASVRGKWAALFGNGHPITLELACGKGEYSLALGARYPDRNFIGMDIKGDRIWDGALRALQSNLSNVHFLRAHIDHLCNYFAPGEIEEIWIIFPDPYPRKSKKKKRLTHPVFLRRYAQVMRPGGIIHLKTDSDQLFAFTLEIIDILKLSANNVVFDLYNMKDIPENLDIRTYYENRHLKNGRTIKYVSFTLNEMGMDADFKSVDVQQLT
ncbi:MAG: tRNA (guanosine(46)-N7)-methyltransferase TrmB [Balneolales bacterium]